MRNVADNDVIIVGGGFSGLSIAALLAQESIPVTLLEAAELGHLASTRNQGWLYSGAYFARRQRELAEMCYASFRRTVRFCPECLEPGQTGMLFGLMAAAADDWTAAWEAAGIPCHAVDAGEMRDAVPGSEDVWDTVFRLPDRSFRPTVLLRRLADVARSRGARIRTGIRVTRLNCHDGTVQSVETGDRETLHCSMVIIATGAGPEELSRFTACGVDAGAGQSLYARVAISTELVSLPRLSPDPFCFPELDGFNHLPHRLPDDRAVSVFGLDRWDVVSPSIGSSESAAAGTEILSRVRRLFPQADWPEDQVRCWRASTVQVMHADQTEPGLVPWPTVIDHAQEHPSLDNLFSVYPGRATLWSHLAEDAARRVVRRLKPVQSRLATPPWA